MRQVRIRSFLPVLATVSLLAGCSGGEPDPAARESAASATTTTAPAGPAPAAESATTTVTAGSTGAATGAGTASAPGATPASPPSPGDARLALLPPAGTFDYDTVGYSQSGEGPTANRTDLPPVTTDVATHSAGDGHQVVTVTTTYDASSTQRVTFHVTSTEVLLAQLSFSSTSNGVRSEQTVTPSPPPIVVRAPYRVGDRWESAWADDAFGVQGVGNGAIERRESVTTAIGVVDAVVVRLDHRIRGSVTGRLQLTLWIDPTTARRVRDETIVDISVGAIASHLESRRTLRAVR